VSDLFAIVEELSGHRNRVRLGLMLDRYAALLRADGNTVRAEAVSMLRTMAGVRFVRRELFGPMWGKCFRALDHDWPRWLFVGSKAPIRTCARIVELYNAGRLVTAGRYARGCGTYWPNRPPPTAWDVTKAFCDVYEIIRTTEGEP